ncbi:MAG: DNA polymerase III subunit gamma and tau [Frankiaceae bacterium]|nr:DNA polymerase III subunit gamma and tau [Frankiaceae bacterium]
MSLALYRKYRPGTFADLKGQEHVTGPLQQALRNDRIHHAYLFSGPRGCGKTSSARILARSLNCEKGPTPDPCGSCDSCVALAPNGPGSLDVVEIDAASHGGVDDARDLRDRAFYAPVASRFKVYIIDEAHMVSREGFNALLKLVEEPPGFLCFVFATTEPEKVLPTIRSRTHHYPFRLMSRTDLTKLLQDVVDKEGIVVDRTVLPLVVRAAQGSARDGLSILDQVLASAGADGVTREAAAGLLGVTPDTLLDDVVDAFAARDSAAVFAAVDLVMERGHDPRRFAQDVLERLRDLVVLDAVPDAGVKGLLDCPADQLEHMGRQASMLGSAGLSRAADLFHEGLTEMRGTTAPRLLLELVCARVLLPAAVSDATAALTRIERLERRLDIATPAPPSATPAASEPVRGNVAPVVGRGEPDATAAAPEAAAAPPAPLASGPAWPATATPGGEPPAPVPPAPAALPQPGVGGLDAAALRREWDRVLAAVRDAKKSAYVALGSAQVASLDGRVLTLAFTNQGPMRNFQSGANVDYLRDAISELLGVDVEVRCQFTAAPGAAEVGVAGARTTTAPPVHEGFAPGDEAVAEDPDEQSSAVPAVDGEDAALRLVESELGGRVVGTVGE